MNIQKPLFGLALLASAALAEAPRTVLFQGTISKAGVALTGNHKVAIDLCESDDVNADDCSQVYTNDAVPFTKGYYSVILGETVALPTFDKQYYLEVSIDGTSSEYRIALTSSPSALNALRADSAKVAIKANNATLADSTKGGALRALTAKSATLADSTKGGALRALTAQSATLADSTKGGAARAAKVTGFESARDTAFLTDAVINLDDTVTFVSRNNLTNNYGGNFLKLFSSTDSAQMNLIAEKRTGTATSSTSRSYSSLILTEDQAELRSGFGSLGGGSDASIIVNSQDVTVRGQDVTVNTNVLKVIADTISATKGIYTKGTTFLKVDALKIAQEQPTGYMGGDNLRDCTAELNGTIMLKGSASGGAQTMWVCLNIGAGSGDRNVWLNIISGTSYGY